MGDAAKKTNPTPAGESPAGESRTGHMSAVERPAPAEPTDKQLSWATKRLRDLNAQDGDFIMVVSDARERRYALADTLHHIATEEGLNAAIINLPDGYLMRVYTPAHMHDLGWVRDEAAPDEGATPDEGAAPSEDAEAERERGRGVDLAFKGLRIIRTSPRDGDTLIIKGRDAGVRHTLSEEVQALLRAWGLDCPVIAVPEGYDLRDLPEGRMTTLGFEPAPTRA